MTIASLFHSFCSLCTIPRPAPSNDIPVRVGIDCKPTIPRINIHPSFLKANLKHFDAISAISSLWRGCHFTPGMEYGIAHQDDYDLPLTDMETLNVEKDHSAKYTSC